MKLTEQQKDQLKQLHFKEEELERVNDYLTAQRKITLFFDKDSGNLLKSKEELLKASTSYFEKKAKDTDKKQLKKLEEREAKSNIANNLIIALKDFITNKESLTTEQIEEAEEICNSILKLLNEASNRAIEKEIDEAKKIIEEQTNKMTQLEAKLIKSK